MTIVMRALAVSILTLVLVRPASAAPAADLKAVIGTALKAQKDFDKQRLANCTAAVALATDQVRLALATPAAGLESVANIADDCLADFLAQAITARTSVFAATETILTTGGVGTPGFLVGDGGALDQFQTKLNGELEKCRKQIEKRLRAHGAAVGKITGGVFRQTVVLPPLRMDIAPAPNTPALGTFFEDILYPPRLFLAIAGSATNTGNDGKLCASGRAFVTFGAPNVNVEALGITTQNRLNVTIASGTGRWRTCFTNLPLGNFRILFDQDPNHDTVFGEVATEYLTIGVP